MCHVYIGCTVYTCRVWSHVPYPNILIQICHGIEGMPGYRLRYACNLEGARNSSTIIFP